MMRFEQRIDFELGVIKGMGFPGYFLIVQDFIAAARKMGVAVRVRAVDRLPDRLLPLGNYGYRPD